MIVRICGLKPTARSGVTITARGCSSTPYPNCLATLKQTEFISRRKSEKNNEKYLNPAGKTKKLYSYRIIHIFTARTKLNLRDSKKKNSLFRILSKWRWLILKGLLTTVDNFFRLNIFK